MFAKSLTASASVEFINLTGISVSSAPSFRSSAKVCAAGVSAPMMMREGWRLS